MTKRIALRLPIGEWRKKFDQIVECVGEHITDRAIENGRYVEVTVYVPELATAINKIIYS